MAAAQIRTKVSPRKKASPQKKVLSQKKASPRGSVEKAAIRSQLSLRPRVVVRDRLRGKYDAAQTTHDNRRHWANADALSADASASPVVRRILRSRARYEVANNSYARGIINTLATDTIGTGPRLQLLTENDEINRRVEGEFTSWAHEIKLAEKLRTMRMARAQDGEAFAIFVDNPVLRHPVKLDLWLIEAERVSAPAGVIKVKTELEKEYEVDGIRFDKYGNPSEYHVLKTHPGGSTWHSSSEYLSVPAPYMIHFFCPQRPEQHRGIPEIMPALPLFAQLRRFTLAVLAAAEAAANFAGILHTDAPAGGESDEVEAMDLFELERDMLLTMPAGWKMTQVESTQPATTYREFKREILVEIARCLNVPYNIAAGDSSGYNYASGRLDHQTYYKSVHVDQASVARIVLDPILTAWLEEFLLGLGGTLETASYSRSVLMPDHSWFWDGTEHVDPVKEAKAQEIRLRSHTTTLAREYGRQGLDWETELRQLAREKKLMGELGIPPPVVRPAEASFEEEMGDPFDELFSQRRLERGGV